MVLMDKSRFFMIHYYSIYSSNMYKHLETNNDNIHNGLQEYVDAMNEFN